MPLTVDEIIQHPGFQNVIHNLNPTTRGTVAVAHNRGGPINIAYEVHGSGPIHIIVSSNYLPGSIDRLDFESSISLDFLAVRNLICKIVDHGAWSLQMVLATSDAGFWP